MLGEGLEFWSVIIGMSLYVGTRDAEKEALQRRLAKTAASACLAYGLSDYFAGYVGNNKTFAAVIIMGFGLFVLDLGTALLLDREFIKELIRNKLGKGDRND